MEFSELQQEGMLLIGGEFLHESEGADISGIGSHDIQNVVDFSLDDLAYIVGLNQEGLWDRADNGGAHRSKALQ
jgi:hypothetical protein